MQGDHDPSSRTENQPTHQAAALVEQSAAAAESLRGQALELQRAVASFRLTGALHAA